MKTTQDVTVNFREYGEITVPKGTRLTHKTASGIDKNYHFVDDFVWIAQNYPQYHKMQLLHDATHYGIDVPKQFVDFQL